MKYYIIAGEASGDLHGSNLMKGLYREDPSADIRFWGGSLMNSVFMDNQKGNGLVHDYKDGAVMGAWEVVKSAKTLLGNLALCKSDILAWQPDVVILIDYPGFNFKIARFAHEKGFKVFYYIAPKTWASRESRNRKLKAHVDKLFIVFPFEIPYFESRGIDFVYKGNPLVDAIDESEDAKRPRSEWLEACGLPQKPSIAMLAGSRKSEIGRMMPVLMEIQRKMRVMPRYEGYEFLIAGAPARSMEDYAPYIREDDYNVRVIFGQTQNIVRHSEAAIVNSGTASLEAALIGTPQVVCWNTSKLTAFVAQHILKVLDHIKYVSLGNLIVDRPVFKELLQQYFTPENTIEEVRRLVEDVEYRQRMLDGYAEIREALGGRGASSAVAREMISLLNKK